MARAVSAEPAWCHSPDPHVPGFCTAPVGCWGNFESDDACLSVWLINGSPVVTVYLPEGRDSADVLTSAADLRRVARWMLHAADMADEAATYLPG